VADQQRPDPAGRWWCAVSRAWARPYCWTTWPAVRVRVASPLHCSRARAHGGRRGWSADASGGGS